MESSGGSEISWAPVLSYGEHNATLEIWFGFKNNQDNTKKNPFLVVFCDFNTYFESKTWK